MLRLVLNILASMILLLNYSCLLLMLLNCSPMAARDQVLRLVLNILAADPNAFNVLVNCHEAHLAATTHVLGGLQVPQNTPTNRKEALLKSPLLTAQAPYQSQKSPTNRKRALLKSPRVFKKSPTKEPCQQQKSPNKEPCQQHKSLTNRALLQHCIQSGSIKRTSQLKAGLAVMRKYVTPRRQTLTPPINPRP